MTTEKAILGAKKFVDAIRNDPELWSYGGAAFFADKRLKVTQSRHPR